MFPQFSAGVSFSKCLLKFEEKTFFSTCLPRPAGLPAPRLRASNLRRTGALRAPSLRRADGPPLPLPPPLPVLHPPSPHSPTPPPHSAGRLRVDERYIAVSAVDETGGWARNGVKGGCEAGM